MCVQDCKALRWPFKVVDQGEGAAGIQITVAGQPKVVTPEEVGAGVLSYLKKVS
jgi:molecular chaperone DnaK (HSP70)